MLILGAAVCGFLLDLLLGDPEWMPHPVVLMGKIISRAEGTLRRSVYKNGEMLDSCIYALVREEAP